MLCTQRPVWNEVWQPRSFTGLMALYDSNYLRLNRLVGGGMPVEGTVMTSNSASDLTLHLECLERRRYTTTLKLTYWFAAGLPDPDLVVRVYHDAHMAEAMSCRHEHRHRLLRQFVTDHGGELQRRWMMNLMLNKWLEYCLDHRHHFGM